MALGFPCWMLAQEPVDSVKSLEEVTLRAFEQTQVSKNSGFSVRFIEPQPTIWNNKTSLVSAFNTVAGVRMEERSPGSYRINIRGSSLRSPFGVRNVKVYWNDIPVTDAGGNTYFNQFAVNNFSSIEVNKGPAGSMYGAGTGGLILVSSLERWKPGISLEYMAGSHGLQNLFASAQFGSKSRKGDSLEWMSQNLVTYSHNETDGYRAQSRMRRDNVSWESKLKISDRQQIRASLLYSDLYYQTPGGLTYLEYQADPRAARPAVGAFPSAINAKAAIFQKTLTAGFTSEYQVSRSLLNRTTLYGAQAEIRNSAVRNYERRKEPGWGGRSVFVWLKKNEGREFQVVAGAEFQKGNFNTQVFSNQGGHPDTVQTNDDISYTTYSLFAQAQYSIVKSWLFLASVSMNKTKVGFTRYSETPVWQADRTYRNEITPRLSVKKTFLNNLSLTAILSRGFSPPTISELLPSTGVISTDLEAEYGWNKEFNIQYGFFRNRLSLNLTGFSFTLQKALVQRRDLSGADYFINAGRMKQRGVEADVNYLALFNQASFFDYFQTRGSFTYNHFRYDDFVQGSNDFSGKTVPSVPAQTYSVVTDLVTRKGFYLGLQFYAATKIFLNDANTALASPYEIIGGRLGWKTSRKYKWNFDLYVGGDNLFDETYSLGNDINAAGGRYFNVAYGRNFFFGVLINNSK